MQKKFQFIIMLPGPSGELMLRCPSPDWLCFYVFPNSWVPVDNLEDKKFVNLAILAKIIILSFKAP